MASDAFMQPVFIELALLCYLLTSWLLFLFLPFAPTSSTGLLLWFNTTALCLTCFVCLLARLEMDSSLCVCVQCFSLIVDNRCACWFWLQPCCLLFGLVGVLLLRVSTLFQLHEFVLVIWRLREREKERKREKEREREIVCVCVCVCVRDSVCVCVCMGLLGLWLAST